MLLTRLPSLGRVSRRSIWNHLSCLHTSSTPTTEETREHLRELLRETAQSVAVVTSFLPQLNEPNYTPSSRSPSNSSYHGATLSSFSSIALDPLPLVAFSLRIPSRMASALNAHSQTENDTTPNAVHFIINVLSAAQPHVAERFARPDIFPRPFEDSGVQWTVSEDGLPILSGALGALSCSLVGPSLPLANLRGFGKEPMPDEVAEVQQVVGGNGLASELFIARVLRVERVPPAQDGDESGLQSLPLLYHRRQYTTVRGLAKSQ